MPETIPPLAVAAALRHLRRWCAKHPPGTEPTPQYPLVGGGSVRARPAAKNGSQTPVFPMRWAIERFDSTGERKHSYPAVAPIVNRPGPRNNRPRITSRVQLLDLLRSLEWAGSACGEPACPSCGVGSDDSKGHTADCALAMAIGAKRRRA